MFKNVLSILLCLLLAVPFTAVVSAESKVDVTAPSAVLIEAESKKVLSEKNPHEQRACASVTKVMTLLLVMEALDSGKLSITDTLTASAHAASMGGSDIWLEEGESMPGVASAEEYAAELMRGDFADIPVAVVHGKTKPDEKEAVMADFAANKYALLVATTVIEVGVDVPNASVMVIENAERFGLSQLHQLRGRVGRGSFQSFCILISDVRSPVTTERLRVMCATNDGFKIADEDLKMRGPGDFFGERQHGLPQMAIADFADTKSLELSQRIADDLLFTYKDLRSDDLRLLKAEVDRLFSRGGQNILN